MGKYKTKTKQYSGTSYSEIISKARREYHAIQAKTPRRIPYIRSGYFTKDKIFINNFWDHLNSKSSRDRVRRLKLYSCSIELIRKSNETPDTVQNPNNKEELLHRFQGATVDGMDFVVQIKENKKTGRKDFISSFPAK